MRPLPAAYAVRIDFNFAAFVYAYLYMLCMRAIYTYFAFITCCIRAFSLNIAYIYLLCIVLFPFFSFTCIYTFLLRHTIHLLLRTYAHGSLSSFLSSLPSRLYKTLACSFSLPSLPPCLHVWCVVVVVGSGPGDRLPIFLALPPSPLLLFLLTS